MPHIPSGYSTTSGYHGKKCIMSGWLLVKNAQIIIRWKLFVIFGAILKYLKLTLLPTYNMLIHN